MEKYALIQCVNGSFTVVSEWSDLQGAKVAFHDKCKTLWNAPDVETATVKIVDDKLVCVENYVEYIFHETAEEEETDA